MRLERERVRHSDGVRLYPRFVLTIRKIYTHLLVQRSDISNDRHHSIAVVTIVGNIMYLAGSNENSSSTPPKQSLRHTRDYPPGVYLRYNIKTNALYTQYLRRHPVKSLTSDNDTPKGESKVIPCSFCLC